MSTTTRYSHPRSRAVGIIFTTAISVGCATSQSVNPRDDSFLTAVRCTFSNACQNYNNDLNESLDDEKRKYDAIAEHQAENKTTLAASDKRISELKNQLVALDEDIEQMQRDIEDTQQSSISTRAKLREVELSLERLRADSRTLNEDVLLESIDVSDIERRRQRLEERRKKLEAALLAAL